MPLLFHAGDLTYPVIDDTLRTATYIFLFGCCVGWSVSIGSLCWQPIAYPDALLVKVLLGPYF